MSELPVEGKSWGNGRAHWGKTLWPDIGAASCGVHYVCTLVLVWVQLSFSFMFVNFNFCVSGAI
jgi:hypothetical protein